MADSPAEVEGIVDALSPWAPTDLDKETTALAAAVFQVLDGLLPVPSDQLATIETEDTAARGRQAYVLAYLKILDFLRKPSPDMDIGEKQARVALSFIRHAETHQLDILQLGRQKGDDKMLERVERLRTQLQEQARYVAEQSLATNAQNSD